MHTNTSHAQLCAEIADLRKENEELKKTVGAFVRELSADNDVLAMANLTALKARESRMRDALADLLQVTEFIDNTGGHWTKRIKEILGL